MLVTGDRGPSTNQNSIHPEYTGTKKSLTYCKSFIEGPLWETTNIYFDTSSISWPWNISFKVFSYEIIVSFLKRSPNVEVSGVLMEDQKESEHIFVSCLELSGACGRIETNRGCLG